MENKNLQRELSIGEILSQTFNLYSRNFVQYLIPFLVAGILTGLVTIVVRSAIVIPTAPVHPTSQQLLAWFPTFLIATVTSLFLSGIVSWIANSITTGITIKFTSDILEKGQANLQTSFNFTLTKLLSFVGSKHYHRYSHRSWICCVNCSWNNSCTYVFACLPSYNA